MSIKWLVIWLIGIFLLSLVAGYLFLALRLKSQEQKVNSQAQQVGFNWQTDQVSAIVFARTRDEDLNPAIQITFTGPTTFPLYNQRVIAALNCSPELSKLVEVNQPKRLDDPNREVVIQTGIDVYQNARKDDIIIASCQNEYCFEIGGACTLKRYVYGGERL